jgi:hypothetical protein
LVDSTEWSETGGKPIEFVPRNRTPIFVKNGPNSTHDLWAAITADIADLITIFCVRAGTINFAVGYASMFISERRYSKSV